MFFECLAASIVVRDWYRSSGGVGWVKQQERHASPYLQVHKPTPPLFLLVRR